MMKWKLSERVMYDIHTRLALRPTNVKIDVLNNVILHCEKLKAKLEQNSTEKA